MNSFKNFLVIWLVGTLASSLAVGYLGLIFGAPSVLVSSIVVTLLIKFGHLKNEGL